MNINVLIFIASAALLSACATPSGNTSASNRVSSTSTATNKLSKPSGNSVSDSAVSSGSVSNRNSAVGSYNCADFTSQEEAQRFFVSNGFSAYRDPYNLDADNNGIACESVGTVAPSSSRCPAGKSWVRPYTRSNGTRVRGHCRKRR